MNMSKVSKALRILEAYGIRCYKEYLRFRNKIKIGFIVNPVAGMGGRIGLKGSDGLKFSEGIKLGAKPISLKRAELFLAFIKPFCNFFEFYSCSKLMGEVSLNKIGIPFKVLYNAEEETSSKDTINAARIMRSLVDLIVFVGGDGTARDIYYAIGDRIPVLGIPSGVKMHSSVFALNVKKAAEAILEFARGNYCFEMREVMDIDEKAFRSNKLSVRLIGHLKVPVAKGLFQTRKKICSYNGLEGIALFLKENMRPDILYIFGPGGTVYEVAKLMGINKTLLGVDLVVNGKLLERDVNEKKILDVASKYRDIYVVVTPIGGQGFIFGRGNQQISSKVLKKVKRENIIIIASESKAKELDKLQIDIDDQTLVEKLCGPAPIVVGYRKFKWVKIVY